MFLSKLKFIGGIRAYLIGGALVCTLLFSAYIYTVYLNNKIDALVTDRHTLTQIVERYEDITRQLNETMDANNNMLVGEIASLNKSFIQYGHMLSENKATVSELTKMMGEIPNEQVQDCLNTDLPDDVVNRMFSETRPTTQITNSSK